jgi:glycosyltransferase involved in cell wall biosynthesis
MKETDSKKNGQKRPLVSICIPTYNAARTVEATLKSIIDQTYRNLEIIVVDNASSDDTLSILQKFDDDRIRIHRNKENIGAEANFSRCIELASGEYTAIFHADDVYMPDMVETEIGTFMKFPNIGAVFTSAWRIDEKDQIMGECRLPKKMKGGGVYDLQEAFKLVLENGNFFMCSSAMVESKIYKKMANFRGREFGTSADLDMWLMILEIAQVAIIDEKLMKYRMCAGQGWCSYNRLRTDKADFFKVVDNRLGTLNSEITSKISRRSLKSYEFMRTIDNMERSVNYAAKGQFQEAKALLKKTMSCGVFGFAVNEMWRPRFFVYGLRYWIIGAMLLFSIKLGLGPNTFKKFLRVTYGIKYV